MAKIVTLTIDGVDSEYVRADSVRSEPDELDGLHYAIVRSRDQGVMAGYVVSIDGSAVELKQARQLWRWNSKFALPDLAEYGPTTPDECKFSAPMSQPMTVLSACGVLRCTADAGEALRSVPAQVRQ